MDDSSSSDASSSEFMPRIRRLRDFVLTGRFLFFLTLFGSFLNMGTIVS
jgi:hypothetical protein